MTQQPERDLKAELDAFDTFDPVAPDAWAAEQPADAVKDLGLDSTIATEVEAHRRDAKAQSEKSFFRNMLDSAVDTVTSYRERMASQFEQSSIGGIPFPGGVEGLDLIAGLTTGVSVEKAAKGEIDEFTKARSRGLYNTLGSFAGGVEQYGKTLGVGVADYAAERKQSFQDKAEKSYFKPRIEGLKDISKESWFTDTVDYVVSGVGEGLGSSAPFFAAGAVGGLPLAGAFGYTSSVGELRDELVQSGVTDEATVQRYAYIAAVPHAILDQLTERGVVKNLTDEAKREVTKGIVRTIVKSSLKGGTKEGVTEAAQRVIELGAVAHANGGEAPNAAVVAALFADVDKGIESTILESGVKGFLPGTVFGAGEVAVDRLKPDQVQEARVRTPRAMTDAAPVELPADARPVAPMMDGPAQPGAPSVQSEPVTFTEPELEAARRAILDAAQALPVEVTPEGQPPEEQPQEATAEPETPPLSPDAAQPLPTEGDGSLLMPEQAVDEPAPVGDDDLDLPAVFADIETYIQENEIDVAEVADETVRAVARAVYEGEDLGVAVDRALGLEPTEDAEQQPVGVTDDVRSRFAEVLASTTPRSQWAEAANVDPETLNTLIDEAVADGRMEIRFGKPVRKAAARVSKTKPVRPEAPVSAPAMLRTEEKRLEAVKSDKAYTAAADLFNARGTPESFQAALDRLYSDKSVKNADLAQVMKAFTGRRTKPKNRADAIKALDQAYKAWAAKGARKNAKRGDVGQEPGSVPEGRLPEEVRQDAGGRDAEGTPDGGGQGRPGDVGGRDRQVDDGTGSSDRVRRPGEEIGAGAGDRPGDGEPRTDSRPPVKPRQPTEEEIALLAADREAEQAELEAQRRDRTSRNYKITDADRIGQGGPKQKVRANIAAIETLKKIEEENRPATDEEKAILVKYVGWGAFSQAIFADYNQEFAKERNALKALLTPDEYKSARGSTINAHYTSPEVIKGMWAALDHLGFKGGRVLEPSAGIGHFIGLQPEHMRGDSAWTAVELDTLSARITKALYGATDVRAGGFEDQKWPNDHFDLAISNVPFAAEGPYDPDYKQKFTLHDYFFVKSLDKVRPGGLVAFITSSGTLDKTRDQARREMEKRGTFLGAIRLPGGNKGAFKANAGTDVTTDILFFRKRMQGEPADINAEWTSLETVKTPEGDTDINGYFVKNPDMMLGKMRLIGSMYGKGEPVLIGPTEDMDQRIAQAAKALPENAMTDRSTVVAPVDEVDTATDGIKEGAFYEKDGKIFRKIVGVGVPQKLNKQDAARVRAFLPIRDVVNEMLAKQASGDKVGMEDLRAALSASYDAFVKEFGPINLTNVSTQTRKSGKVVTIKRMPNFSVLMDDMDAYKVAALESYDAKTGIATKTAIFTEDLLKPYVRPAITGPADALTVSLNEAGRVDMKLIASVLGVSEKRAAQELGDAVFLNPKGEQWQTATQYLSGDVVTKLADAKAAADLDPKYGRNVAALEAVQPIPLTRNEITIPLGASYVPEDVINAFLSETLEAPGVQATLNPATKSWTVRFTGGLSDAARAQWAISSRDVSGDVDRETPDVKVGVGEIVEAALNSKPIQVYTTIGGERIRMPKAEELARAKVTMLKEAFTGQIYPGAQAAIGGWVWNDEARATRMEAVYNNAMNRLVKEQHDGSHLTFPGLARVVSFPDGTTGTINLPAARTGAIWRIIQNGNTLIDHVVGAGKTWTSIMAVQEMKRLGQIRRPMFVVPNHMLMQFSAEFLQAYPGAKLLVATKDSMSKAKRAEFAAKAAAERWDGIIITHSAFSRLKMQDAAYKDYYEEILSQMESAKKGEEDSATVKDIVKAQKRIKAKLDSLIKKESKDQGVTFEELGVDHITVDEAHLFKNLWFMTRHTRVKGISNSSESQRATDLYIKIRHLEKSRPGRSALFLTGTPLSNTMAEVYTMMRYLQRPTLEEYDIAEFDSWAQTFGMIDTRTELASNAKDYTDITSFSKFVNIPELSTLYGRIADTQTAESLGLQRPAIKGGMPQVIMSEPSPIERSLLDTIIKEMERLKGSKPEKGAPNFLSMFTKGLQASTDARLVDPSAPYNPDGKIGKAVDNIYRIWEEGNKDPAKPDKAQVVFLDMGVPGSRATAKPMKPGTGADENVIDVDPLEAVRQGLADTGSEIVDEAEDGEELQPEANEDDAAVESMMAGKFNLYEDIKGHLVEKGMPADQIAFIHDAKNDDQKAKMFEAVREGKIRVLIGSTGKMGVGTNVQKRLVALHHIDAPWRPSDLEQRDGRILRQGNKNPEIQIYRYITKRSFEAYRWQILERKASFIAQFRAGARGLRIAEDIDSPLPDASEIKAAATGDSRIVEMADMERTVRGLLAQASAHAGVAVRARQALANVKNEIERVSKRISILESDAARVTDLRGDAFKITANLPGGKTAEITERKKAGEALKRYITTLAANAWYGREIDIEFGTISGFDVAGVVKKGPDGIEVRPEIRGSETYRAKSAFFLTDETNPVSIAQSYERLVSGVPDLLADAKLRLASEEAQIPGLEAKTVATAFPKQAELEEKQKRLVELQEALKPKKKVVPGSDEDLAARGAKALADMQTPEYLAAIDAAPERDTSLVPGFMSLEWKAARTYNTPEGEIVGYEEGLQHFVANAVKRTPAKPRQERKVFLLLGMAGSGKSTIAKSIGEAYGATHIVADDAKPMIPEYDQGRNSAGVHEESSAMAGDATGRLARTGYNLIIEKIGSSTGSIRKIVELFKNAGYRVNLLFVSVPKEIAMERAVKRWRKTGRAVPMESYTSLDIPGVYDNISSEGNVDENAIIRWNEETGSWINEGTGPDIGQLRFGSGATETVQSRVEGLDRNEVPRRSFEEVNEGPVRPALNDSGVEVGADETGQTPMFSLAGLYHGSMADIQYDQQGRLLVDPALFGSRTGLGEQAFFLTPNVTLASRYAEGEGGRVYRAVVETENFQEVKGWNWRQEPERVRQTIEAARAAGKDGVLFRGMQDGTGIVGDQYAVINPQAIRAFDGSLFEGRKLGLMTGNTYADTALEWANNDVAEAMATLQRQRDLGKAIRKATWSKADDTRYSEAFEALKKLDPSVSSPARKSKIMSLFGMASIAGGAAQQTSENLVVADAGTQERLLKMPSQRLRAHARGLSEAGLDRAALDAAIDAIGKDRGLVAKDWVAIAQAYTAGPVDGESAAAAVKAIRKAFAERVHDLSLAELGGFDPGVSGSNLDWRPEARAALSALAARLPEGTGFTVRNFIEIATRSSSMRQGLEIEGGMFTPEQAERQLGLDPRSARKIMAISLAYGPDVALQTFTHEEIHAVREFLTDKEWGVLSKLATRKPKKSEALRLIDIAEQNGKVTPQYAEFMRANAGNVTYREIYGIDNRYGRLGLKEDRLVEEVVAHVAADWADGHDFGTRIERVMMKIRDLIEALGNLLKGQGFETVDSVFNSIWSGEVAKRAAVAGTQADPEAMFAIGDAETGRAMRRDLDALGYYSGALEAAKALRQAKGTPEQMLAMLKKEGAKDSEIAATGLQEFLAGKASVTKDEIVKHIEGNRPTILEKRYSGAEVRKVSYTSDGLGSASYSRAGGEADAAGAARWSAYSLDEDNPTYRETVLHLPLSKMARLQISEGVPFNGDGQAMWAGRSLVSGVMEHPFRIGNQDGHITYWPETFNWKNDAQGERYVVNSVNIQNAQFKTLDEARRAIEASYHNQEQGAAGTAMARARDDVFRSGHFSEPNIIGHMMTSMTYHQGKPVFTIDQIQSDWGQKLRDGGVRDEAKIAELEARLKSLETKRPDFIYDNGLMDMGKVKERFVDPYKQGLSGSEADALVTVLIRSDSPEGIKGGMDEMAMKREGIPELQAKIAAMPALKEKLAEFDAVVRPYFANRGEYRLAEAELRTAEAATPGNPLVNTTDQWVNTTLRRAIRQAAEANAEYIAIPSGDTVLSYNPGDKFGMKSFYGGKDAKTGEKFEGIVPKNLRKLLTRLDRATPAPQMIETLDSPSGKTGLGKGFTLFKITDQVKESVIEDGQAMFSLAGNAKGARPRSGALEPKADAMGRSRVLAETDLSIYPDQWVGSHPYEWADEAATALRQAVPSYPFRVERSGSAAGDSAYVKTPVGDIRLSDHGAHPKAGILWQGPSDEMSPRKAVNLVANRMQETVDKLLAGPAPNRYGSPRPNWMTADQWRTIYDGAVNGGDGFMASLAGDQNGTDVAQLNQAIDGLKRALGIHVSQNLFGVTIKSDNKYVRINPRANIRGQTSRATGGVGVRRSRDIRAIAHEGGHSLELMLGERLDAIKATFAKSLVTPFAPDMPMPNLAQSGYAGLELDDVEQAALVEAVSADKDLRDWSTRVGNAKSTPLLLGRVQYDDAQYRAVERKAAFMRANLVRLVGEKRADGLIDDVRQNAPTNPPQYVRERFSPMGAPKRRLTPTPAGDALSEAFARWFEKYVMARESAEEMAPEFFAAFEDLLEAEAPSVLEGLHTVQATYKAWTKRATVEDLASDVVSVTADNTWKAIADGRRTITQTISGRMAEAYTAVIDDLAPMQAVVRKLLAVADRNGVRDESGRPISLKVSENPYKIARMFRGSYATGYTWIKDGISNYGSERIAYPGLQRAMETIFGGQVWDQRVYQAFGQYLISKRAIAEFDRLAAKTKRLADIESILKTGGESWRVTSTQQATDREVLARRQDALDRVSVLTYDRTRALRVARSAERRIQERMQKLRDDLAESLRAIDDGSDAARATRDRNRRALQVAERDARRARNDVVDAELELTNLETDQALLRAEVAQIEQRLEQRQTSLDALEDAIGLMRRERDATAKRGASRPPTLESREWHEAFLAKVASDKRYEKFEEAAQTVYAFTHGLLTVRYQAGLIPEELYRELSGRKDWYVPFMRDMSDAEPETVFMGASARAWSPFKKFDGSDRAIINPLEIISQEAYATAQHIAMNEAVGALDALAQKAGPGSAAIVEKLERTEGMENTPETWQRIRDIAISMGIDEADATLMVQRMEMNFANEDLQALWSPSTKGPIAKPALPLWENGVRRHVVINDAEFGADALQAMMGLGKEQMHWLLEMFGKPARLLQIGVTTHPTFMPRNLIRDVFDAWIKTGALPIITQVRGARALLGKDGEFLRQYTAAGGILGGRNIAALTSKEQQANLIDMDPNAFRAGSAILGSVAGLLTGSIMAGPLGGMAGTVIGYAGARHGGLLKMVEAVESMTRLGVAAEAYKRALVHNPSLSQDEAMLEAAYVARDVFDWNRRGSKTLGLVRMITFLNAQIQGLDRAVRAIGGSGDRGSAVAKRLMMVYRREHDIPLSFDEQRDLGDAYKTYARLALYTALLLGLYAMYRDDDQYEDIKDRTKATHSWLPGFLGVDVRIPKAFEWAIPSNFVEVLWDKMEGRDPRAGERMLKSAQEVLVPPGVPQALNLAVGWTTNTDLQSVAPWLFGEDADKVNRKIVPDYLKGLSPEAQFDAFTSQLSKDMALAMAKAGVPESSIPSPKMIDFTLRTGGYWGQDIGKAYQAIKEGVGYPAGPQPRVPDWPIVGGFTGISARQSKSVDELYRLMSQQGGDFVTAANTYKNMLDKAGNPAEAEAFLGRLEPESRAYAILAYHFTTADKRRHPLERASAVAKVTRDIRKEVVLDRLAPMKKQGRKTVYDRENAIALLPKERTVIMDIMERLAQAESWNGFVALGREGWTGKAEMAVQPILDELKAANKDVYSLYIDRLDKAKVESFDRVRSEWPALRDDLLRNGADALLDGKSGVKAN